MKQPTPNVRQLPTQTIDLTQLPELLWDYYEQSEDGSFLLQLEGTPDGFVERPTFDELQKQADEQEMLIEALQQELEEAVQAKPTTESQALEAKNRALEEKSRQIEALHAEVTALKTEKQRQLLEEKIRQAVEAVGELQTNGWEVLRHRIHQDWQVDESGKMAAFQNQSPWLDEVGNPIGAEQYVHYLFERYPWAFKPSAGASAPVGANFLALQDTPVRGGQINLTELSKLYRENPTLAKQLAHHAGKSHWFAE